MYQEIFVKDVPQKFINEARLTKTSSVWQHYHFIYYLKFTKNNFQQKYDTMCRAHYIKTKKAVGEIFFLNSRLL